MLRAIEAMRNAMREESPARPPSYADAFVRLIDVGYEDATVAVARVSAQRSIERRIRARVFEVWNVERPGREALEPRAI